MTWLISLTKLAQGLLANGPHKLEKTSRRVRALYDGLYIFDTTEYVFSKLGLPLLSQMLSFEARLGSLYPQIMLQGSMLPSYSSSIDWRLQARARFVWEHPYYPQFYVPSSAIRSGLLTKDDAVDNDKSAFLATLKSQNRSTDRVLTFEKGPLSGLVRFEFSALGKVQQILEASQV